MSVEFVLVTGPRDSGKTTWCSELAKQARSDGIRVVGLLSPAVFEGGRKVGIDTLELASGERKRLASLRAKGSIEDATIYWEMHAATLSWANQILRDLPAADLFILDELGPVEFLEGKGLQEGLRLIDKRRYSQTYAVVRPELLSMAMKRWPWGRVHNLVEGKVFGE